MKNSFNYKIYSEVYDEIIRGNKTIEIRLLNEKSDKIKNGDEITFSVLDSDKTLTVEVIEKYIFENIDELFKNKYVVKNSLMNYTNDETKDLLYNIFGKEKVDNSKIVGIEFRLK